jgi:imidazolonepropionase-like amidohydrolase
VIPQRSTIALAGLALFAAACTEPAPPETLVIVGATLVESTRPPLPNSVVVIREGRIAALGAQQTTPIPPGSRKFDGTGKYLAAANPGAPLITGEPADLVLFSANPLEHPANQERIDRRMQAGKWMER